MDHHGPLQPQAGEGLGHRIEQLQPRHPQHLAIGPERIDQRAQQVEHGANPQTAPQGCQPHQGWMPARGKQEGEPCLAQGCHHLLLGGPKTNT